MIRRPPRSTLDRSSAASDVYKRQMILGPNGSGKSSFLKIFSGEINRFQGTVLYENKKIKELRKEELAKKRAVMSQQADLGFPLLVEEVVLMGRYSYFTFNPYKKDITICSEVI